MTRDRPDDGFLSEVDLETPCQPPACPNPAVAVFCADLAQHGDWADHTDACIPVCHRCAQVATPAPPAARPADAAQRARRLVELLLRKADSTPFPDEAAACRAKADELRRAYRL